MSIVRHRMVEQKNCKSQLLQAKKNFVKNGKINDQIIKKTPLLLQLQNHQIDVLC